MPEDGGRECARRPASLTSGQLSHAPSPFTTRESQILGAMANGLNCRDIGIALGISEFTVRKHRSNMLAKVEVHNAARLVALARICGWLMMPPIPQLATLSARERAVMALVIEGCTSKKIARELAISDLTVRKHRENLLRKLGIHTTAQLVAFVPAHDDVSH